MCNRVTADTKKTIEAFLDKANAVLGFFTCVATLFQRRAGIQVRIIEGGTLCGLFNRN